MTSERKTEDRIEEMQINFYVAQPAVNKIESHGCEGETGRCRCAVDKKRIYERGRQIWQEVRSEVQSEEGRERGRADSLSRMHRRGSPSLQHYRHSRDALGFEGGCSTRGMTTGAWCERASEERKLGVV